MAVWFHFNRDYTEPLFTLPTKDAASDMAQRERGRNFGRAAAGLGIPRSAISVRAIAIRKTPNARRRQT